MKSKFSLPRIALLCKKDLYSNQKGLILFFIAFLIIDMILSFVYPNMLRSNYYIDIYQPHIAVILVLLTVLISFSFHELDYEERKVEYLTLPATLLEKYFCRWFLTLSGYLFLGVVIYIIDSFFVWGLNIPRITKWETEYLILNPGNYDFGKALLYYLVLHSVFFFGSIYFKKNEYVKTSIVVAVLVIIFLLIMKILNIIYVPGLKTSFFLGAEQNGLAAWAKVTDYSSFIEKMGNAAKIFITLIIPPFLWVLGYFRLKEEEAANGVQ